MDTLKALKQFFLRSLASWAIILFSQTAIANPGININPLAPPNTQSPQDTLTEFLAQTNAAYQLLMEAMQQSNQESGLFHSAAVLQKSADAEELMEQAIRTLNLTNIPAVNQERVGLESALRLKEILDRIQLPPAKQIPDVAEVKASNLTHWEIPGSEIAIAKVTEGPHIGEFLFSPDTIGRLKTFYAEAIKMSYQPGATEGFYDFYVSTPGSLLPPKWSQWLPKWSKIMVLEQTLWQWFALIGSTVLAIALIRIIYNHQQKSIRATTDAPKVLPRLFLPLIVAIDIFVLHYVTDEWINITGDVFELFSTFTTAVLFLVAAWLTFLCVDVLANKLVVSPKIARKGIDASLIRTVSQLLGGIAAATVLYFGAQQLGVPVAPLLASFGAVSLAISFGAQEYFKNVVGGLTLFLDRPVSVGDFCESSGLIGVVEEIGLRSTRIRTLDRTLVSVPNSAFSNSQLVNYSKRDRRLFNLTIGLQNETTREQLEIVLAAIREHLENHPLTIGDRIRFIHLDDYSLNIEIFTFFLTTDHDEYLKLQEELLLKIMQLVEQSGTDFAYPSQRLYLAQDSSDERFKDISR